MADPLSTVASVIAVAGLAASTSKKLIDFFQKLPSIPADIEHSFRALHSLHQTLLNVQEESTNAGSSHQYAPYFCERLRDCVADLAAYEAKLYKISAKFDKQNSVQDICNGRVKRFWQKVKWQIVQEEETIRFLNRIKLYHAEFSMYLLVSLV